MVHLKLERAEAEVEPGMAKACFDALGLAAGATVLLRHLEFGLFLATGADPAAVRPQRAACSDPQVPRHEELGRN